MRKGLTPPKNAAPIQEQQPFLRMIIITSSLRPRVPVIVKILFLGCALLCAASAFATQPNYTLIDLTATGSYGDAYAASGGAAAGTISTSANFLDPTRAALWAGNTMIDLHPALLGTSPDAKSAVQGFAGTLQVGWGLGPNTGMLSAPIAWRGTPQSASLLAVPFATYGAQALATDGVQIVGFAGELREGGGPYHALVWDANTGAVADLGAGAEALSVAHGQQAGYSTRSSGPVATIWAGTSASKIVLHPNNDAVTSQLLATNGLRQVGFCGFDIRVVDEGAHGNHTKRINNAFIWDATAASARSIHPPAFLQSYATGINGSSIVGYAYDDYGLGAVATYHAILWNSTLQPIDLNGFLPDGFTGAMANSIDAEGVIAGTIFTAEGLRHAALWIPTKPPVSQTKKGIEAARVTR
jgi:hypothetical protein